MELCVEENIEFVEKEYIELAQKMVTEFFEDNLEKNFDKKKRAKMAKVFEKTRIYYSEDFEDNVVGTAYPLEFEIRIRKMDDKVWLIGNLIHEYGHIFSYQDGVEYGYGGATLEEGNLDRLAELSINHYLKKYGELKIGDRKLNKINIPYIYITGYENEDSVTKTLLYPLSKDKKDVEALSEYLLGEKSKYIGMILDKKYEKEFRKKEKTKKQKKKNSRDFTFNYVDIFITHSNSFESIDRKSIYWKNNTLIPAMVLQNRLVSYGESIDISENILDGQKHSCAKIEKIYFNNRKLYDISYQELKEFCELIKKQDSKYIQGFDEFVIGKFAELSDEEIKIHYSEILDVSRILIEETQRLTRSVKVVLSKAINFEIPNRKNISENVMVQKYNILTDYFLLFSNISSEYARSLIKEVNNLRLLYAKIMGNQIRNGNVVILDAINTNFAEALIAFDRILEEGLNEFGVKLDYDSKTKKILVLNVKGDYSKEHTAKEIVEDLQNVPNISEEMNKALEHITVVKERGSGPDGH